MDLLCVERLTDSQFAINDKVIFKDMRVLRNLLDLEPKYIPPCNYFGTVQKDIQPFMRKVVATWMSEYQQQTGRYPNPDLLVTAKPDQTCLTFSLTDAGLRGTEMRGPSVPPGRQLPGQVPVSLQYLQAPSDSATPSPSTCSASTPTTASPPMR
uniref:Uncharacterized protein n=1 Tax=Timema bartmani TaxID=61472 RepID=A0A7R9HWX4_9NEOP|nr:unnamed protein product [Timema bartmani]